MKYSVSLIFLNFFKSLLLQFTPVRLASTKYALSMKPIA